MHARDNPPKHPFFQTGIFQPHLIVFRFQRRAGFSSGGLSCKHHGLQIILRITLLLMQFIQHGLLLLILRLQLETILSVNFAPDSVGMVTGVSCKSFGVIGETDVDSTSFITFVLGDTVISFGIIAARIKDTHFRCILTECSTQRCRRRRFLLLRCYRMRRNRAFDLSKYRRPPNFRDFFLFPRSVLSPETCLTEGKVKSTSSRVETAQARFPHIGKALPQLTGHCASYRLRR